MAIWVKNLVEYQNHILSKINSSNMSENEKISHKNNLQSQIIRGVIKEDANLKIDTISKTTNELIKLGMIMDRNGHFVYPPKRNINQHISKFMDKHFDYGWDYFAIKSSCKNIIDYLEIDNQVQINCTFRYFIPEYYLNELKNDIAKREDKFNVDKFIQYIQNRNTSIPIQINNYRDKEYTKLSYNDYDILKNFYNQFWGGEYRIGLYIDYEYTGFPEGWGLFYDLILYKLTPHKRKDYQSHSVQLFEKLKIIYRGEEHVESDTGLFYQVKSGKSFFLNFFPTPCINIKDLSPYDIGFRSNREYIQCMDLRLF